MIYFLEGTFR